ncbi:MAG: hypothetical protein Q8Q85_08680, partial [Gemmatimonadales bacterium]|nr:hypothetical protein [Gemmatimonadales bacterium]
MRRSTPLMHSYAASRARDEDPRETLRRITGVARAAVPRTGTRLTPVGLLGAARGLGRLGVDDGGGDTDVPGDVPADVRANLDAFAAHLEWIERQRIDLAARADQLRLDVRAGQVSCGVIKSWNDVVHRFTGIVLDAWQQLGRIGAAVDGAALPDRDAFWSRVQTGPDGQTVWLFDFAQSGPCFDAVPTPAVPVTSAPRALAGTWGRAGGGRLGAFVPALCLLAPPWGVVACVALAGFTIALTANTIAYGVRQLRDAFTGSVTRDAN